VNTLAAAILFVTIAVPESVFGAHPPRFDDYPATATFTGEPAPPRLVEPAQKMYRTRITEGVAKGWGVERDGKEQKGPNFAGDVIVIQWGCGSPCLMMALVNARTGEVSYPPISIEGIGRHTFALPLLIPPLAVSRNAEVEFRLNSRLMIVHATLAQTADRPSYTYYFLWSDGRWTLLQKTLLKDL
jgi:hypothetical protein